MEWHRFVESLQACRSQLGQGAISSLRVACESSHDNNVVRGAANTGPLANWQAWQRLYGRQGRVLVPRSDAGICVGSAVGVAALSPVANPARVVRIHILPPPWPCTTTPAPDLGAALYEVVTSDRQAVAAAWRRALVCSLEAVLVWRLPKARRPGVSVNG